MDIAKLRQAVQHKQDYINDHLEYLYNSYLQQVYDIYTVFKNYFGEDLVDLQNALMKNTFIGKVLSNSIGHIFTAGPSDEFNTSIDAYNLGYLRDVVRLFQPKKVTDLSFHFLRKFTETPIDTINKLTAACSGYIYNTIINGRPEIIIHFPKIRVTNERDRFIDIEDLWAKVVLSIKGCIVGNFTLNRSTYSEFQFRNNYMHSHVRNIRTVGSNPFTFQEPCLGTGPIQNTILTLCTRPTINRWKLFCVELDTYVKVESLAGVPWHKLESLGDGTLVKDNPVFSIPILPFNGSNLYILHSHYKISADLWKDFIKYFIRKKVLKFRYVEHYYTIAMSYIEYITAISNAFIEWYNLIRNSDAKYVPWEDIGDLISKGILDKCIVRDGYIYRRMYNSHHILEYKRFIGQKVLTFKGEDIKLNIYKDDSNNDNESYLLQKETCMRILQQILNIINFRYGTKSYKQEAVSCAESITILRERDASTDYSEDISEESVWYI